MSAQLQALRLVLAEQFPDARPLAERDAYRLAGPVPTGIAGLDRALPGGGLPRGKLTAWTAITGAAAILRTACRAVLAGGERAAWVDASRTLTFGWTAVVPEQDDLDDIPLVIHPPDRIHALRAAELLLRSGAFALTVLDGVEPVGTEAVRLSRAAREGGGAFVLLAERASMAALRISSRLDLVGIRWRRGPFGNPAAPVDAPIEVRVSALGWNARARINFPVAAYDLRCALEPGSLDRRGAR